MHLPSGNDAVFDSDRCASWQLAKYLSWQGDNVSDSCSVKYFFNGCIIIIWKPRVFGFDNRKVNSGGKFSGTPNDGFEYDGTKGYEVQVDVNLPLQFKKSPLFAVANILTDAGNVVDEKAECCNLGQGIMGVKIASSHQGISLTGCYLILGYWTVGKSPLWMGGFSGGFRPVS